MTKVRMNAIRIVAIGLILLISGCTNPRKVQLQLIVEQINSDCPITYGNFAVFEQVSYQENKNEVFFKFLLNEDGVDINSLGRTQSYQKEFLANYLRSDISEFLKKMIDADATLSVIYKGMQSQDSMVLTLTPQELKTIADAEPVADNKRKALELSIASANALCPDTVEEGLVMTGVSIADDFVCYYYTYDTELFEFEDSTLPHVKEAIYQNLKQGMETEPTLKYEISLIKECKMGIRYIYSPKTEDAKTKIVTISAKEVAVL